MPTDCSTLRRRQASLGCGQNRPQDRSRRGRQRHAVVVGHSSVCRCVGRYQHCLGATSSPDPTTTVYVTMVVTRPDDSAPAAASICLSVCLCIGVGGVNNPQPWRQSDRPLRPTDDWRLIPTPRTHASRRHAPPSRIPYAAVFTPNNCKSTCVRVQSPQPRRCRVTVLGKLFTPVVPLFTEQRNW